MYHPLRWLGQVVSMYQSAWNTEKNYPSDSVFSVSNIKSSCTNVIKRNVQGNYHGTNSG